MGDEGCLGEMMPLQRDHQQGQINTEDNHDDDDSESDWDDDDDDDDDGELQQGQFNTEDNHDNDESESDSWDRDDDDNEEEVQQQGQINTEDNHDNDESESDWDRDDDDDEDDDHVALEGAYDPADYENMFHFITRYTPPSIELEHTLKPFIPDFIPSLDIDTFIKITRPDQKPDTLGLTVLDEPCSKQSDPAVLHLQLRAISNQTTDEITDYDDIATGVTGSDHLDNLEHIENVSYVGY